jgi:phosphoribosyl-ATP pyrophosphohydrolase
MEPLMLATTGVVFLSSYMMKAGEKVAEEVGKKLPEAAARVWNAVMTRFKGNVVAEAAV